MSGSAFVNHDKAVGMLVAAAAGDALGWPQENRSNIVGGAAARDVPPHPKFREWTRNAGSQYGRYLDPVRSGDYSDDTQLMLAVARACLREDWYRWLTAVELPIWPTYQRGGGGAVLSASRSWGEGRPPWIAANESGRTKVIRYFDAGANGVAMRVAPHALVTVTTGTDEDLVRRVIQDGITTHGHPRALVGACVHALGVRYALRQEGTLGYGDLFQGLHESDSWRDPDLFVETVGEEWTESHAKFATGDTREDLRRLWQRTCSEVDYLSNIATDGLSRGATANDEQTLGHIGVFDPKQNGSGTVCAVAALYVASRTAPRPMGGLLRTGFLRDADTDTLCSMTGTLLGALQGTGWLGALFSDVQDREYMVDVGLSLAAVANNDRPPSTTLPLPPVTPTGAANRKWVKAIFDGRPVHVAPDGREIWVQQIFELDTKTRNFVGRAVVVTKDGQTLIVDRVGKTPAPVFASNESSEVQQGSADTAQASLNLGTNAETSTDPSPQVLAVEIAVPDLVDSVRFFERVLGFKCEQVSKHRATVGHFLVLSSARGADNESATSATVISVSIDNLDQTEALANQFGGLRFQRDPHGDILWIKEPGGNVIRGVAVSPADRPSQTDPVSSSPATTDSEAPPTSTPAEVAYMQDALFESDSESSPR